MRPRQEHNDDTRQAIITAAEQLLAEEGPSGLQVRTVASRVGATTQAVYTLFGSKDGLISVLALRLYEMIATAIDQPAETDDPSADLVEVAVTIRNVVCAHPWLYRIAFQRVVPGLTPTLELNVTREAALAGFGKRFGRLVEIGHLAPEALDSAMLQFSALIEGLANTELRGDALRLLPVDAEEMAWREAITTLLCGFHSRSASEGTRLKLIP